MGAEQRQVVLVGLLEDHDASLELDRAVPDVRGRDRDEAPVEVRETRGSSAVTARRVRRPGEGSLADQARVTRGVPSASTVPTEKLKPRPSSFAPALSRTPPPPGVSIP
ncbi:MAG: hypothetical protein R2716_04715 [Microthrixaceae bacterium]